MKCKCGFKFAGGGGVGTNSVFITSGIPDCNKHYIQLNIGDVIEITAIKKVSRMVYGNEHRAWTYEEYVEEYDKLQAELDNANKKIERLKKDAELTQECIDKTLHPERRGY